MRLRNPFGNDGPIAAGFEVEGEALTRYKQFCFAKGVRGPSIAWMDENPYMPAKATRSADDAWIPCSPNTMPQEDTEVLVTREFLGTKDIPASAYVEMAMLVNGDWVAPDDEYKCARHRHTDPVAWMPKPKPYGQGQSHRGNTRKKAMPPKRGRRQGG